MLIYSIQISEQYWHAYKKHITYQKLMLIDLIQTSEQFEHKHLISYPLGHRMILSRAKDIVLPSDIVNGEKLQKKKQYWYCTQEYAN